MPYQSLYVGPWSARATTSGDPLVDPVPPTARGRDVLQRALEGSQMAIEQEIAGLSAEQRQVVIQAMQLLRGVFGGISQPTTTNN